MMNEKNKKAIVQKNKNEEVQDNLEQFNKKRKLQNKVLKKMVDRIISSTR